MARIMLAVAVLCGVISLSLCESPLAAQVANITSNVTDSTIEPTTQQSSDTPTKDVPTTTTKAPPTTTAGPTSPKPSPTTTANTPKPEGVPTYSLKNSDGKYCMILQANIVVTFNTTDNQTVESTVPYDTPATGSCGKTEDDMNLVWNGALDNVTEANMTLTLKVTSNSGTFQLSQVSFDVAGENETFSINTTQFKTSVKSYYKCDDKQTISTKGMKVEFTKLRLLAFSPQADTSLDKVTVNNCKATNKTDTIVPIAVGVALAVMVLIVLIGYCIGRRRTRPGYQQMAE